MVEKVTRREVARRLGLSESAVRKHLKSGLYRAGRDGLIDFEVAEAAWLSSRDPDAILKGQAGAAARRSQAAPVADTASHDARPVGNFPENSLVKARAAAATITAQRQKLALERERGEVIKTDDAIRVARQLATLVSERLDGLAGQIGARGAGRTAIEIEKIAREIVHAIRQEIAALPVQVGELRNG